MRKEEILEQIRPGDEVFISTLERDQHPGFSAIELRLKIQELVEEGQLEVTPARRFKRP